MNPDTDQNTFDLDLRAEQSNFDQALNTSTNSEQRSYVFEMDEIKQPENNVVSLTSQSPRIPDREVISPMESTDFTALTDVTTTVIKIPGSINDKYIL